MKDENKQRADRVIKVFKDSKLNQRQFSELIGVSQQLVSAVVNYTKKPNETILLAIIDNIKDIDPMWLLTGTKKEDVIISTPKNNSNTKNTPETEIHSPIEFHIKKIVKEQVKELSKEILERISNIEESVKEANP
jgi:restriction endonuclease Mrr